MKPLLTISLLTLLPAVHFLATGNPDSFCAAFCLAVLGLALWLAYEMELHARELDRQLDEWELEQKREQAFTIMMNKRVIRRELISEWEKIG